MDWTHWKVDMSGIGCWSYPNVVAASETLGYWGSYLWLHGCCLGGTAGCVVAGRLAEADPSLEILLIEGGANNYNVPSIVNPAVFLSHLNPSSKTTIFYKAIKSKWLADRECVVPAGGTLGGGSSINFMVYTRAQRDDFDSWQTPGWSADELLPYLKKIETYHGPGKRETHGFSGPVQVSHGTWCTPRVEDDWLQAARIVGYPEVQDLQDLDTNNGFERWLRYVSPDGRRSDAAHAYIHPLLRDGKHPNLHVLVESKVLRVLFDAKNKACGVEYVLNPDHQPLQSGQLPKQTVTARKLVVLSCGTCGSPLVLERSGIGSAEVLKRAGVPVVEDLPGVGRDYQDHHLILYPYRTSLDHNETLDAINTGRLSFSDAVANKNPLLGWNACNLLGKLRPSDAEVSALGPEFQRAWDANFRDKPNRPLMLLGLIQSLVPPPGVVPEPGQYVSVALYTAYPYSRGYIHITGPELADPLDFDVGFFSDKDDIDAKKQLWAYKKGREIMRRTAMYRGEVAWGHAEFPPGSKAACVEDWTEVHGENVSDIEYSAEDDQAILKFLRENINTTWHSLGTVKMAPREKMGAVDADLNVYGVSGLKVVDISIVPENVGSNTNNTAFVVGEKGADIIINELGLGDKYE
ncbi:GMC oxidoreductase [Pseudomassariella vexata]|uniref:GMC oxidoreductase n=1 Tax=Pseudomassariella vexata TaxID=1141098 RepID=A0A1Y2EKI1_9PEZI|nr:GMC oxidoreductase [Pseudomassariella vexata]ORY72042.1 GMC oxidoreductase [Pseudomassariella vexata]